MAEERKKYFPLAYDINGLASACGRVRSTIFEETAAGRLIARKAGGKTIVLYADAIAWLEALPIREPSRSALQVTASA